MKFPWKKTLATTHTEEEWSIIRGESTYHGKVLPKGIKKDELVEAQYHSSLLLAAGQVTRICLDSGKPLDEVLELYTKTAERLRNWFCCVDLEQEIAVKLDERISTPWELKEKPAPRYMFGKQHLEYSGE